MKASPRKPPLPSKDELVAFISGRPGKIGTREIARAFSMKNTDRVALKRMLRELADEGRIERRRKRLHRPGVLPQVVVADVSGRDADGELIAVPTEWDEAEHGPAAKIRIRVARRARPAELAGVGDRALLRVEETDDEKDAVRYNGRVIKLIGRAKQRVLGIFRSSAMGGGRLEPIDKKQLGHELLIPAGAEGEASDGELVAAEVTPRRSGYGLAGARVKERLGSLAGERAISLIAIHAHSIPHVFPTAALAEAEAARPAPLAAREDWRTMAIPRTPGGSSSRSRSLTSLTMCTPDPSWIGKLCCVEIRFISRTGSSRCCRSASRMIFARSARERTAPRSAFAWSSAQMGVSVPIVFIAC
jgi:ribonuclease R